MVNMWALIASMQPANEYSGGDSGIQDSEYRWMHELKRGIAPILSTKESAIFIGPDYDFNKSGGLSYADNVAWVNAQPGLSGGISFHSNALGNACILYGTSNASKQMALRLQTELNAAKILPFGDTWELNDRKVSETSDTYCPFVLLEVGQHDDLAYAQWLREGISSGSYPRSLAGPISRALGFSVPTPSPVTVPVVNPISIRSRIPRSIVWRNVPSDLVKVIQYITGVKPDGNLGPITKASIGTLQEKLGLKADQLFGPNTAEHYLLSLPNLYRARANIMDLSAAVRLIQWIGTETADGVWGDKTQLAIKEMQVWAKMSPDGNVGEDTKRAITK